MKLLILLLILLLSACKSTMPTQEELEAKEISAIELLNRVDAHYSCLDLESMEFGNTTLLSGSKLERVNQYIREFNKTKKHYNDLNKGRITSEKYLQHAQRLKGYGKDVYYDYIQETGGEISVNKVLRGHYCESLLKNTNSEAYKKTLTQVLNFKDPDYDAIGSKAILAIGSGLSKLVPSSSTVGSKQNLKTINNKLRSKYICSCTENINPSSSNTHSVVFKLSERLCKSVSSEDFISFLNTEVEVYKEKVRLRNIDVTSVDESNLIYKYNEKKKSDPVEHFKNSQRENSLVHYISELSPYLASMRGNESDIELYNCIIMNQAKMENNLLY